ncbi:hypothetical protein CVT25_001359 [Psilocybe cyanescens]|uniref:Uncharacterized protein n=1 Tax=Psilocybe cyanescens TaxID=93625 RepID=A0A409XEV8_PSICY|nr:hypothetical protein CVT25_001359 [Psilocybe cyanescens]
MDVSKLVVKIVFGAGLAFLVRLTENRIGYQFHFPKSIGGPPLRDDIAPCYYPRILEDLTPLVFETKLPAVQVSREAFNLTARHDGAQLELFQNEYVMAGFIGVLICSLLAIITATLMLSSSHKSKQQLETQPLASRRHLRAFTLGKEASLYTVLAGSSDSSRQPRDHSPSLPGGYPGHFDIAPGSEDRDINDFRNYPFSRWGPPPPPPPPPPPMYTSSMSFDDNRNVNWLSLLLLLPVLMFILKRLGRVLARYTTNKRDTSSTELRIRPATSVGTCANVIPLYGRKAPTRSRFVEAARNSSIGRYITTFVGVTNPIPPSHLMGAIISGVRLLRRILKVMILITFLLHSCVLYMVPLITVCVAWYYLPDMILSLLLGTEKRRVRTSNAFHNEMGNCRQNTVEKGDDLEDVETTIYRKPQESPAYMWVGRHSSIHWTDWASSTSFYDSTSLCLE